MSTCFDNGTKKKEFADELSHFGVRGLRSSHIGVNVDGNNVFVGGGDAIVDDDAVVAGGDGADSVEIVVGTWAGR
jgi:hypothetical protein